MYLLDPPIQDTAVTLDIQDTRAIAAIVAVATAMDEESLLPLVCAAW